MARLDPTVDRVTERIRARSAGPRRRYLERVQAAARRGPHRFALGCSNLAHGLAACTLGDKDALRNDAVRNVAIVSAYNDMLSAHQPFETFPQTIREAVREVGATAQLAGGVPAMCDGVTQGHEGMELSLFSRDVIAMSTAVALSHGMFDAALCLGVCDKIVPGLLIGALSFGHLPVIFVPAGPMPSGLSNREKARVRQLHAEGKVGREELLAAELGSYHSPGTCTFYGTANSNQMFMELMGLHLPGASFVNPGTPLRDALTRAAAQRVVELVEGGDEYTPIGEVVDERAIVNALVGLLATGGSTNHTIHLVAIGRAAGVMLDWSDFDELSRVVPLLARVYPNGSADVNHLHQAGGLAFLIGELIDAGLVHEDTRTVAGPGGLGAYRRPLELDGERLMQGDVVRLSGDPDVLRGVADPFQPNGGLRLVTGRLGRAVAKVSAVKPELRRVEAPARVFVRQEDVIGAFEAGELDRDVAVVVRFQGPRSNGMPELHKLMSSLGVLQDRGHRVALITDGRLSGASGKVPSAIHVSPEAAVGGPLARLRDGDRIVLDPEHGVLDVEVTAAEWQRRDPAPWPERGDAEGMGRELFAGFRRLATGAEEGASSFGAASVGAASSGAAAGGSLAGIAPDLDPASQPARH